MYTIIILLVVIITYNFPQYFIEVGGVKLTSLITPVLQIIMFGMGTTITLEDFIGIVKTPKKVGIGVALQFLIMPLWGFGLAKIFGFPPEISDWMQPKWFGIECNCSSGTCQCGPLHHVDHYSHYACPRIDPFYDENARR